MTTLSLKRRAIQWLERNGAQRLLARGGTALARRISGQDVGLHFDGIWVRRIGDVQFGDKPEFDYYLAEFRNWPKQHRIWLGDPPDFWLHNYTPAPGDVIIDVGAGFGNDVVIFSRGVGPTGRVVAIEAHPKAALKLEKTLKWSGLTNATPQAIALGDKEGRVRISGESDSVESTIADDLVEQTAGFDVPMRRFDDVMDELDLGEITFIKMNIEGAETAALRGMPRALAEARQVAIACHDFRFERGESEFFRTKEIVRGILQDAGFIIFERADDPRPYVRDILYGHKAG